MLGTKYEADERKRAIAEHSHAEETSEQPALQNCFGRQPWGLIRQGVLGGQTRTACVTKTEDRPPFGRKLSS